MVSIVVRVIGLSRLNRDFPFGLILKLLQAYLAPYLNVALTPCELGSGGFSQPKRITPGPGDPLGQLYKLSEDLGETKTLYSEQPKEPPD